VTNTGGAFSFARGNNLLLEALSALIIFYIILWVVKREQTAKQLKLLELIGVGFLIGGALGNLCDRITLGHVIDFLDFAFINFPVFNLADVCVDIGIVFILLGSFL
jgi:signal peptidase II